ncbi:MAG: YciI family protein [Bacteroidia bacterium]
MKKIITFLLVITGFTTFAQRKMPPVKNKKPRLDSAMIRRTGADEYGMKKYVMCFLKTGPNKSLPQDSVKKLVAAHLKNITKLASQGKLSIAGPFTDGTELEGIFIFNVRTVEEAKALIDTDPGVKAGIFSVELHPWYASAALTEIPLLHKKIQGKDF